MSTAFGETASGWSSCVTPTRNSSRCNELHEMSLRSGTKLSLQQHFIKKPTGIASHSSSPISSITSASPRADMQSDSMRFSCIHNYKNKVDYFRWTMAVCIITAVIFLLWLRATYQSNSSLSREMTIISKDTEYSYEELSKHLNTAVEQVIYKEFCPLGHCDLRRYIVMTEFTMKWYDQRSPWRAVKYMSFQYYETYYIEDGTKQENYERFVGDFAGQLIMDVRIANSSPGSDTNVLGYITWRDNVLLHDENDDFAVKKIDNLLFLQQNEIFIVIFILLSTWLSTLAVLTCSI